MSMRLGPQAHSAPGCASSRLSVDRYVAASPRSLRRDGGPFGWHGRAYTAPRAGIRVVLVLLYATLLSIFPARFLTAQTIRRMPEIREIAPVRAPALTGGVEWLNTATPLDGNQLQGKIVVLDFWTYCCINCLHILPDLKQLEKEYPNEVVVIGVHAPKFVGERDSQNVREAILRHDIRHPVVNDANAVIAKKYQVSGWPSLRVLDPRGNVIGTHDGEATYPMLNRFMKRIVGRYRRAGELDETPIHFALERFTTEATPLRFPGKVLADPESRRLFIADSGHHRIVVTDLAGKLLHVVGSGITGKRDGPFARASFSHPQGMAYRDNQLYVADTENHLIRLVDFSTATVRTIAGTGEQANSATIRSTPRPTGIDLASPWALELHEDNLYIAMAGMHQIWRMRLTDNRLHTFAGSGTEDIVDGELLPRMAYQPGSAAFAQPSGLATDGTWLYVADSEGSSVRGIPLAGRSQVSTILGTQRLPAALRLFTFGDRDGALSQALLQHPLGLAHQNGRLYVADTYNNKIKRIDLESQVIETLVGQSSPGSSDAPAQFNEPSGLSVLGDQLFVADTNNHAIRILTLDEQAAVTTLAIPGLEPPQTDNELAELLPDSADAITLSRRRIRPIENQLIVQVALRLPANMKLSPESPPIIRVRTRSGDPTVSPRAEGKPIEVEVRDSLGTVAIPLQRPSGTTTLEISLAYFFCETTPNALCRRATANWICPLELTGDSNLDQLILEPNVRIPDKRTRR